MAQLAAAWTARSVLGAILIVAAGAKLADLAAFRDGLAVLMGVTVLRVGCVAAAMLMGALEVACDGAAAPKPSPHTSSSLTVSTTPPTSTGEALGYEGLDLVRPLAELHDACKRASATLGYSSPCPTVLPAAAGGATASCTAVCASDGRFLLAVPMSFPATSGSATTALLTVNAVAAQPAGTFCAGQQLGDALTASNGLRQVAVRCADAVGFGWTSSGITYSVMVSPDQDSRSAGVAKLVANQVEMVGP